MYAACCFVATWEPWSYAGFIMAVRIQPDSAPQTSSQYTVATAPWDKTSSICTPIMQIRPLTSQSILIRNDKLKEALLYLALCHAHLWKEKQARAAIQWKKKQSNIQQNGLYLHDPGVPSQQSLREETNTQELTWRLQEKTRGNTHFFCQLIQTFFFSSAAERTSRSH